MAHCVPMFEFTSHSQRNKVKLLTPATPLHHCGNCSSRTCCSGSLMAHNGAQTHQVVSLCRYFLTLPVTSWGDTSLCIVDAKIRGGGGIHSFHITGSLGDYTKLCACICWKIGSVQIMHNLFVCVNKMTKLNQTFVINSYDPQPLVPH